MSFQPCVELRESDMSIVGAQYKGAGIEFGRMQGKAMNILLRMQIGFGKYEHVGFFDLGPMDFLPWKTVFLHTASVQHCYDQSRHDQIFQELQD